MSNRPRPRRIVSSRRLLLFRFLGWRYSNLRGAWVFRPFNGRFGPVLRSKDDPVLAIPSADTPRLPLIDLTDGAMARRAAVGRDEAPAEAEATGAAAATVEAVDTGDATRWPFLAPKPGSPTAATVAEAPAPTPAPPSAPAAASEPFRPAPLLSPTSRGAREPGPTRPRTGFGRAQLLPAARPRG